MINGTVDFHAWAMAIRRWHHQIAWRALRNLVTLHTWNSRGVEWHIEPQTRNTCVVYAPAPRWFPTRFGAHRFCFQRHRGNQTRLRVITLNVSTKKCGAKPSNLAQFTGKTISILWRRDEYWCSISKKTSSRERIFISMISFDEYAHHFPAFHMRWLKECTGDYSVGLRWPPV